MGGEEKVAESPEKKKPSHRPSLSELADRPPPPLNPNKVPPAEISEKSFASSLRTAGSAAAVSIRKFRREAEIKAAEALTAPAGGVPSAAQPAAVSELAGSVRTSLSELEAELSAAIPRTKDPLGLWKDFDRAKAEIEVLLSDPQHAADAVSLLNLTRSYFTPMLLIYVEPDVLVSLNTQIAGRDPIKHDFLDSYSRFPGPIFKEVGQLIINNVNELALAGMILVDGKQLQAGQQISLSFDPKKDREIIFRLNGKAVSLTALDGKELHYLPDLTNIATNRALIAAGALSKFKAARTDLQDSFRYCLKGYEEGMAQAELDAAQGRFMDKAKSYVGGYEGEQFIPGTFKRVAAYLPVFVAQNELILGNRSAIGGIIQDNASLAGTGIAQRNRERDRLAQLDAMLKTAGSPGFTSWLESPNTSMKELDDAIGLLSWALSESMLNPNGDAAALCKKLKFDLNRLNAALELSCSTFLGRPAYDAKKWGSLKSNLEKLSLHSTVALLDYQVGQVNRSADMLEKNPSASRASHMRTLRPKVKIVHQLLASVKDKAESEMVSREGISIKELRDKIGHLRDFVFNRKVDVNGKETYLYVQGQKLRKDIVGECNSILAKLDTAQQTAAVSDSTSTFLLAKAYLGAFNPADLSKASKMSADAKNQMGIISAKVDTLKVNMHKGRVNEERMLAMMRANEAERARQARLVEAAQGTRVVQADIELKSGSAPDIAAGMDHDLEAYREAVTAANVLLMREINTVRLSDVAGGELVVDEKTGKESLDFGGKTGTTLDIAGNPNGVAYQQLNDEWNRIADKITDSAVIIDKGEQKYAFAIELNGHITRVINGSESPETFVVYLKSVTGFKELKRSDVEKIAAALRDCPTRTAFFDRIRGIKDTYGSDWVKDFDKAMELLGSIAEALSKVKELARQRSDNIADLAIASDQTGMIAASLEKGDIMATHIVYIKPNGDVATLSCTKEQVDQNRSDLSEKGNLVVYIFSTRYNAEPIEEDNSRNVYSIEWAMKHRGTVVSTIGSMSESLKSRILTEDDLRQSSTTVASGNAYTSVLKGEAKLGEGLGTWDEMLKRLPEGATNVRMVTLHGKYRESGRNEDYTLLYYEKGGEVFLLTPSRMVNYEEVKGERISGKKSKYGNNLRLFLNEKWSNRDDLPKYMGQFIVLEVGYVNLSNDGKSLSRRDPKPHTLGISKPGSDNFGKFIFTIDPEKLISTKVRQVVGAIGTASLAVALFSPEPVSKSLAALIGLATMGIDTFFYTLPGMWTRIRDGNFEWNTETQMEVLVAILTVASLGKLGIGYRMKILAKDEQALTNLLAKVDEAARLNQPLVLSAQEEKLLTRLAGEAGNAWQQLASRMGSDAKALEYLNRGLSLVNAACMGGMITLESPELAVKILESSDRIKSGQSTLFEELTNPANGYNATVQSILLNLYFIIGERHAIKGKGMVPAGELDFRNMLSERSPTYDPEFRRLLGEVLRDPDARANLHPALRAQAREILETKQARAEQRMAQEAWQALPYDLRKAAKGDKEVHDGFVERARKNPQDAREWLEAELSRKGKLPRSRAKGAGMELVKGGEPQFNNDIAKENWKALNEQNPDAVAQIRQLKPGDFEEFVRLANTPVAEGGGWEAARIFLEGKGITFEAPYAEPVAMAAGAGEGAARPVPGKITSDHPVEQRKIPLREGEGPSDLYPEQVVTVDINGASDLAGALKGRAYRTETAAMLENSSLGVIVTGDINNFFQLNRRLPRALADKMLDLYIDVFCKAMGAGQKIEGIRVDIKGKRAVEELFAVIDAPAEDVGNALARFNEFYAREFDKFYGTLSPKEQALLNEAMAASHWNYKQALKFGVAEILKPEGQFYGGTLNQYEESALRAMQCASLAKAIGKSKVEFNEVLWGKGENAVTAGDLFNPKSELFKSEAARQQLREAFERKYGKDRGDAAYKAVMEERSRIDANSIIDHARRDTLDKEVPTEAKGAAFVKGVNTANELYAKIVSLSKRSKVALLEFNPGSVYKTLKTINARMLQNYFGANEIWLKNVQARAVDAAWETFVPKEARAVPGEIAAKGEGAILEHKLRVLEENYGVLLGARGMTDFVSLAFKVPEGAPAGYESQKSAQFLETYKDMLVKDYRAVTMPDGKVLDFSAVRVDAGLHIVKKGGISEAADAAHAYGEANKRLKLGKEKAELPAGVETDRSRAGISLTKPVQGAKPAETAKPPKAEQPEETAKPAETKAAEETAKAPEIQGAREIPKADYTKVDFTNPVVRTPEGIEVPAVNGSEFFSSNKTVAEQAAATTSRSFERPFEDTHFISGKGGLRDYYAVDGNGNLSLDANGNPARTPEFEARVQADANALNSTGKHMTIHAPNVTISKDGTLATSLHTPDISRSGDMAYFKASVDYAAEVNARTGGKADYIVVHMPNITTDAQVVAFAARLGELAAYAKSRGVQVRVENAFSSPGKAYLGDFAAPKEYHTTDGYMKVWRAAAKEPAIAAAIRDGTLGFNPDIAHIALSKTQSFYAELAGGNASEPWAAPKIEQTYDTPVTAHMRDVYRNYTGQEAPAGAKNLEELYQSGARIIGTSEPIRLVDEINKFYDELDAARPSGAPPAARNISVHLAQTNGIHDGHMRFNQQKGDSSPPQMKDGKPVPVEGVRKLDGAIDMPKVMDELGKRNVTDMVVEQGGNDSLSTKDVDFRGAQAEKPAQAPSPPAPSAAEKPAQAPLVELRITGLEKFGLKSKIMEETLKGFSADKASLGRMAEFTGLDPATIRITYIDVLGEKQRTVMEKADITTLQVEVTDASGATMNMMVKLHEVEPDALAHRLFENIGADSPTAATIKYTRPADGRRPAAEMSFGLLEYKEGVDVADFGKLTPDSPNYAKYKEYVDSGKFYYDYGKLLTQRHLLGMTDGHDANTRMYIKADGEVGLIPIDNDAIGHYWTPEAEYHNMEAAMEMIFDSIGFNALLVDRPALLDRVERGFADEWVRITTGTNPDGVRYTRLISDTLEAAVAEGIKAGSFDSAKNRPETMQRRYKARKGGSKGVTEQLNGRSTVTWENGRTTLEGAAEQLEIRLKQDPHEVFDEALPSKPRKERKRHQKQDKRDAREPSFKPGEAEKPPAQEPSAAPAPSEKSLAH